MMAQLERKNSHIEEKVPVEGTVVSSQSRGSAAAGISEVGGKSQKE